MIAVLDSTVAIGLAKGRVFVRLRELPWNVHTSPGVRDEVIRQGRGRPGSRALGNAIRQGWIHVDRTPVSPTLRFPTALSATDCEILSIAASKSADFIRTDDRVVRREADRMGMICLSSPEVVSLFRRRGLLRRVKPTLDLMRRRSFGIPDNVYEHVLRDLGEL